MDWIDVEQELPPPKTKVKLSYGLLRTGAAVCDDWVSEGWLLESGTWSVKLVEGMPKWPEPTHWKYLENEIFGIFGIYRNTPYLVAGTTFKKSKVVPGTKSISKIF